MKREDLKALELTDDLIDKIMALHGKDIEKAKADLSTAQTEAASLKKQLEDAGKQIEDFKKQPDVAGVQKAADEWKAKAEQAEKDAAAQIAQLRFDHALDGALSGAKVKNTKTVRALLDLTDLKLEEDGTIRHLDTQLEQIKKDNDFLFESDTPQPKLVAGGHNTSVITDPVILAARKAAGLPTNKE